jgi:23S rRNA pseudouridine2604 synthase
MAEDAEAELQAKEEEDEECNLGVPISKWLALRGLCTRKQAKRFIDAGRVTVDGVLITGWSIRVRFSGVTGSVYNTLQIKPGTKVTLDGSVVQEALAAKKCMIRFISRADGLADIIYHKPRGVLCSTEATKDDSWTHLVKTAENDVLFSVGRLDKDSEGMTLCRNSLLLAGRSVAT